jgi:hypothetical protein
MAKLLMRPDLYVIPFEKRRDLEKLFSNITPEGYHSSSYVALLFLKGYFLFEINDFEGAINTWIVWAGADKQETSLGFKVSSN